MPNRSIKHFNVRRYAALRALCAGRRINRRMAAFQRYKLPKVIESGDKSDLKNNCRHRFNNLIYLKRVTSALFIQHCTEINQLSVLKITLDGIAFVNYSTVCAAFEMATTV